MKKLVLINTLYYPIKHGGAEKSVRILAEKIAESGRYSVTVLTLTKENNVLRERVCGVDVIRIPLTNLYWPFDKHVKKANVLRHAWHLLDVFNIPMAIKVYKVLKSVGPDIVHTNNLAGFSVSVWVVVRILNIPLLHTVRDYYLMARNSTLYAGGRQQDPEKLSTQIYSWPKKILSRLVDCPVAISKAIGLSHQKQTFFSGKKCEVIYNGVDLPNDVSLRAKGEPIVYGYIGRLVESKGVDILLDAFQLVVRQRNVRLLIAGQRTEWFDERLQQCGNLESLDLMGWVEFDAFIKQVDVVIVPSRWQEPFGRVVIEAYAYGRPVIVSNRGGLPEITDQYTGLIFDADLVEELAKVMLDMENLISRRQFDANTIRNRAEAFSIGRHIQKYMQLYDLIYNQKKEVA